MSEAARKDDPIEHSSALEGLLTGLAVGAAAALIGVAIVGTGGLAAVAIVGAGAALGAGIGELIGSLSFCTSDAGQIIAGSVNVFINGLAAARAHLSTVACDKHSGVKLVAEGSDSVYINGQPAARKGDRSTCDGKISAGSPNVFIGGGTQQTDEIDPEVPGWLHAAVFGIGIGSAILLGAGPGLIVLGLAGGFAGGVGGHWLGGKIWGEGTDGQKLMAFGGAMLGGFVGGKGGQRFDARYQVKVEGLGSNFGNVRFVPRQQPPRPTRGPDGRFIRSSETPPIHNRKTEYPSGYRSGIKDKVLDDNTITSGPHKGKVMTVDGEIVSRTDPRITIEHNKPVVEHWNEIGYNTSRAERLDFYNETSNMSIRLRSANSSDGARMGANGVRYRQDVGPGYE